ncbi:MAG: prolyl oligopeptidase family serine peptidase [Candidatus Eiseniibacteriota bacterium]
MIEFPVGSPMFLVVFPLLAVGAAGASAAPGSAASAASIATGTPHGPWDYPSTEIHVVADTLHGTVLTDPYRWLESATDPAVQSWTDRQNAFTRSYLDRFAGRPALRAQYEKLFSVSTVLSGSVVGPRVFFERKDGLKNQPTLYVRDTRVRMAPGVADKVALDPNTFSADGTVALDWWYPSADGSKIAYGKSEGGSEQSTMYVRDLAPAGGTGNGAGAGPKELSDVIPRTQYASVAWDPDGKSFLYSRHPQKGEVPEGEEVFHTKIFHHRLGDDWKKDAIVWDGAGAPIQEFRAVSPSSDYAWTFLTTSLDWSKNDLYIRKAGTNDAFVPVAKGLDGQTNGDVNNGRMYLLTNVGAPRYKIVSALPGEAGPAAWRDVVPEQEGVIESFQIVNGRLVLQILENASSRLRIHGLDGRLQKEIALPTLGTVSKISGDPKGTELYFRFVSFVHPSMVYRYDFTSGTLASVDPGRSLPYDPANYETRQEWTASKDGARIPMFIVQRKGTPRDGERPTILYGYGGFNVSETPEFRASVLPWLDQGGVFVLANLRGGGEFGREWHEAGRLGKKQNVFDDFYACAEWLVKNGVTRTEKLACDGGSNGGLLVGAAITQRPELWGAAVCEVPLLDMIRYQNFSIARYWVPEYGSSENPEQFKWLLDYSPYHNVMPGVKYPPTMFMAGASDARVDPLHACKMTALVRANDVGPGPILLRVEGKAGHGQGKPTSKRIDSALDVYSFLMMQFGMSGKEALP